jgi:hypothetical protein
MHATPSLSSPRLLVAALAALLTACQTDGAPTGPTPPRQDPPGLGLAAFHLTIDAQTGRITTAAPAAAVQASRTGAVRPALSLVGSDAVALHASNCAFSAVPNNTSKRRCTFTLAVENRLEATDLDTASTFPRLPAGTSGIVVFPFTAAALGVPGGGATPSPDWDRAPANFFNDFAGCSGKASDCYRSETYAAPLSAGETSAARTVGFDVDRNAQSVSAYVVVAADLRDNPLRTLTIGGEPDNCGSVTGVHDEEILGDMVAVVPPLLGNTRRGLCSFSLAGVPAGAVIASATLRAYQESASSSIGTDISVIVDHLDDYGSLGADDFDAPALADNIGTLSATATVEYKSLAVTSAVAADLADGRTRSSYRIRLFSPTVILAAAAVFSGPGDANPPQLVIVYRNP